MIFRLRLFKKQFSLVETFNLVDGFFDLVFQMIGFYGVFLDVRIVVEFSNNLKLVVEED